jgi:hypothetical protein
MLPRFRSTLCSALVLLSSITLAAQENLDVFKGCGLEGTAQSNCAQRLNRLKNRSAAPSQADIDADITLEAILEPGDDLSRWSTSNAAQITGIVASVIPGGRRESCNCGRDDLRDIHINVVLDDTDIDEPTRYVIAEITPRMQHLHHEWTFNFVKGLEGKRVRFTGWMLFDGMHSRESLNTKNRSRQQCGTLPVNEIWRATAWEIHPVTAIDVLADEE